MLLYALPYLLLLPDYVCYEKSANGADLLLPSSECVPSNFCLNTNIRAEKVDNKNNLQNWITLFDMQCVNPVALIAFNMLLYGGMALGAFTLAPMSDKHGRKFYFSIAVALCFIINVLLLYCKDYHDLHYSLFLYGICLSVVIISGLLLMTSYLARADQS